MQQFRPHAPLQSLAGLPLSFHQVFTHRTLLLPNSLYLAIPLPPASFHSDCLAVRFPPNSNIFARFSLPPSSVAANAMDIHSMPLRPQHSSSRPASASSHGKNASSSPYTHLFITNISATDSFSSAPCSPIPRERRQFFKQYALCDASCYGSHSFRTSMLASHVNPSPFPYEK